MGNDHQDQEVLAAAIRSGDQSTFSKLIDRHQRSVFFLGIGLGRGDEQFARDLVQKTFLQAWTHRKTFRGDSSFRTWIMKIAQTLALNEVKRAWRRREVATGEPNELDARRTTSGNAPGAFELLARGQARQFLRDAVNALPERQRTVTELRLYGNLSFAEIAQAIEITENNAKVSFHHAVRGIRKFLAERGVAA